MLSDGQQKFNDKENVLSILFYLANFFFYQVSAIEAKVEHEAEFDNMEIINEKQENNKEVEINEDTNAR